MRVLVVGEDALCCAFGERLVHTILPDWTLARESINTGGITKLKPNLYRYVEQAHHVQPVVCVADTDGRCPVDLVLARCLSNRTTAFLLLIGAPGQAARGGGKRWVLGFRFWILKK